MSLLSLKTRDWALIVAILWIASGLGVASSRADDVQVNSYTTGDQGEPSVAVSADGDFVVVWQSFGSGATDSSAQSIQGQRYASDGSTLGAQFQVNTYTSSAQFQPSVGSDADGDFVVVWASVGSGGTDTYFASIQGQRYASDGSTVGAQFQVNTYTTYAQTRPEVALSADGDFVVVWTSTGSVGTDSSNYSVQGQRYASDGTTAGAQFQVNTYTTSAQYEPKVALSADGDFVVVWASFGSVGTDSSYFSIQGQRYASDGTTAGAQFQVNTYTTSFQYGQSVGSDADGDFVVVWESSGSGGTDSSYFSVQGQRYASDGTTAGAQFQVNTYTTAFQRFPSVAFSADGDFVVVWASNGSGGSDSDAFSIQGQRYASDGATAGAQFQVNTYTVNSQYHPSVGLDSDGDFVAVWTSNGSRGTDGDFSSIQARLPIAMPPVLCAGLVPTISGTVRDDPAILGTEGDDVIHGFEGDDVIDGLGGHDVICAGSGNDDVTGGDGDDILLGEDGEDMMLGGPGEDMLLGGAGIDILSGDNGDDFLNGGQDDDRLFGNRDDDMLLGSWGDDELDGGRGVDFLIGHGGDDELDGGADDDRLVGSRGDDVLLGNLGNDRVEGGPGNDLVTGNAGNDLLLGGDGDDLLNGGKDDDSLTGDAGIDVLKGGPGNDLCDGETEIGCEVSRGPRGQRDDPPRE